MSAQIVKNMNLFCREKGLHDLLLYVPKYCINNSMQFITTTIHYYAALSL